jgi:hypothetical protein
VRIHTHFVSNLIIDTPQWQCPQRILHFRPTLLPVRSDWGSMPVADVASRLRLWPRPCQGLNVNPRGDIAEYVNSNLKLVLVIKQTYLAASMCNVSNVLL